MGNPQELPQPLRLELQQASAELLQEKYLEEGETLEQLQHRVACSLALAELIYTKRELPTIKPALKEPPTRFQTLLRRFREVRYPELDEAQVWDRYGGTVLGAEEVLFGINLALHIGARGPHQIEHAIEPDSAIDRELLNELIHHASTFLKAQQAGVVLGGRIAAALGRDGLTTAINCFVIPIATDSMDGILTAQAQAAQTMRKSGGVGYNFSPIRPRGALVRGTRSVASGPLSFMSMYDATCATVASAGARRGAQMGILEVTHPDIRGFVDAKKVPGVLTNFNLSVAIVDGFMEAVEADRDWQLVHQAEPDAGIHPAAFRREDGLWVYETVRARELWDHITKVTYEVAEPGIVFLGRMNQENNLAYCEVIIATNPCSEHPLPAYGCCCLASINLTRFVKHPYAGKDDPIVRADCDRFKRRKADEPFEQFADPVERFDCDRFKEAARIATRMLDNVLDMSRWPLEEQYQEAMTKRRIGIGVMGLGSALMMLDTPYGSSASEDFVSWVCEDLACESYLASSALAQERGSFPLFEKKHHSRAPFIKRLPPHVEEAIAMHGIRNSHLLSIAPTGTISLTIGDNCSNGIEPVFALEYDRHVLQPDGSRRTIKVEDHAIRVWRALGNPQDSKPPAARTASELTVEEHLRILAAAQKYVDAAISKTVNVPVDYPFADFQRIYTDAYRMGIKCVSAYRPNPVRGAVLVDPSSSSATSQGSVDPDRRITLTPVGDVVAGSVRWPDAPELPGCESRAWPVTSPEGKFYVTVSTYSNGINQPFQVLISGDQAPRGLPPLAKMLSGDLRTTDRRWVQNKLQALKRAQGQPFDLAVSTSSVVPCNGAIAALAVLVESECIRTGWFDGVTDDTPAPLLEAMASRKEPKTTPDGTPGLLVDILNPATGDDCMLVVKEAVIDDQRYPVSVWLTGNFAPSYVGILKSLSIDMRVRDTTWIAARLQMLRDYAEPSAEFLARTPGADSMALVPSTIAYIARLLLHRYHRLALLDAAGQPTRQAGLFADPPAEMTTTNLKGYGRTCPSCQAPALIRKDGCDFCTSCGHNGGCG